MKITLKKFASDPYKFALKAPLIITVNEEKRFALIPYANYVPQTPVMIEHTEDRPVVIVQDQPSKKRHWYSFLFD